MNLIPEIAPALRSASDSPASHNKQNGTDREVLIPEVAWALHERDAKGSDSSTKDGHLIPVVAPMLGGGNYGQGNLDEGVPMMVAHTLRSEGHDASEDGTGRGVPLAIAFRGREGGITAELGGEVANAVRSGAGSASRGGHVFARAVRRLTPTECERLQGFPDGWTAGHSDSGRYRMLGNAVCVPVAEWIGRRMRS